MDKLFETKLNSQEIYKGRIFSVTRDEVTLSDGYKTFRDVVHHNGGVVIAAELDGKILLVKQFRYPTAEVLFELPAGKLDKPGETILDAAKRELEEETGYIAQNWKSLGFIWTSPGFCTEKLYLFQASNLLKTKQHPDIGEIIDFEAIDKNEVFEMIKSGIINDAKTIAALMRAYKI